MIRLLDMMIRFAGQPVINRFKLSTRQQSTHYDQEKWFLLYWDALETLGVPSKEVVTDQKRKISNPEEGSRSLAGDAAIAMNAWDMANDIGHTIYWRANTANDIDMAECKVTTLQSSMQYIQCKT